MAVYLDPMVDYGVRHRHAGPSWCHMIADTIDELHCMAGLIGVLSYFQEQASFPHYDIGTERVRKLAIFHGAIECDRRTFVKHMRRIREQRKV